MNRRPVRGTIGGSYVRAVSVAALVFVFMFTLRECDANMPRGGQFYDQTVLVVPLFAASFVGAYVYFVSGALAPVA